jgi:hypothetical protein
MLLLLAGSPSLGAANPGSGLRVVGFMRYNLRPPFDLSSSLNSDPLFLIDPVIHRGLLLADEKGSTPTFVAYDLEKMRRVGQVAWPSGVPIQGGVPAVDVVRHRMFVAEPTGDAGANCSGTILITVDERSLTSKRGDLPCVNHMGFAVTGLSYYGATNKLYVVGMPSIEYLEHQTLADAQSVHSTIIGQVDAETLKVDWTVDVSPQCNWQFTQDTKSVVARQGGSIVSFCYAGGASYNFGGARGQAVLVPLKDDKPITMGGRPVVQVSPTFPGAVHVNIDPMTGRLLIRSDSEPYGPAVWGYDALNERFFGVVPAGVPYGAEDDEYNGFDEVTGRLYRMTPKGIVVVDGRQNPLSGGVIYPVLTGSHGSGSNTAGIHALIGIDGNLRRLFFPYPERGGFVVVEDTIPPPDRTEHADPDLGTADVAEVPGSTTSAFSGSADAFGVHIIDVGGIPGAIDNYDQTCFNPDLGLPSPRNLDPNGRCLADQLVTAGNREFFLAETGAELGSESGVSAFGTVFRVPANDSATDADFRSLALCFTDRLPGQVPASARDGVATFCRDTSPLGQFQNGTHDKQGKDVPFPGSVCVDETNEYAQQSETNRLGGTGVHCDSAKHSVDAKADSAIVALPDVAQPALSVAHASSTIETVRTAEGVVTTVTATASGIRIGGVFTIGRVYAEAVTKAHGRSGTTAATFTRLLSDVRGPGFNCVVCDPQQVVDAFNQIFSTQARLRLPGPFSLASPHGYQGLLVKDPSLRASDVTILNDDTDTFNGLDLIVNNDGFNLTTSGPNARSRLVVGLAGVHAESRYGIFPVLAGGGGNQVPPITSVIGNGPGSFPLPGGGGPVGTVTPPPSVNPAQIIRQVWQFVVNHPAQAALLFVLWMVLASPVYFGMRSRSLARSLRA